jgi:hypothetical protein
MRKQNSVVLRFERLATVQRQSESSRTDTGWMSFITGLFERLATVQKLQNDTGWIPFITGLFERLATVQKLQN